MAAGDIQGPGGVPFWFLLNKGVSAKEGRCQGENKGVDAERL